MQSPLPDSSALEAGILEDTRPSRLSRVQDNVRNLLRNSMHYNTPPATPMQAPASLHLPPTPPETPTYPPFQHNQQPEVLPSPTESLPSTASPASSTASLHPTHRDEEAAVGGGGLFPPPDYRSPMAGMSALFTGRAVAALNHPDVSDPSLAVLAQQKRQRNAWRRKRSGDAGSSSSSSSRRRRNGGEREGGGSQCLLCVVAALMLGSVVATYLILATTTTNITATFHILFILGIILATIVFAHTLIRLLLFSGTFHPGGGGRRAVLILPTSNKPRHHHHRRRHHNARRGDSLAVQTVRVMPGLSSEAADFVPATPIRVQMNDGDEVRLPDAAPTTSPQGCTWDKPHSPIANPPPAYGRWRGSVRANPDLLHWQAISSPIADDEAHELPSPTYEEAMLAQQRTGPPSYMTRESPARMASREDVRGSVLVRADAREQVAEPEMVEVVGRVGLAK